MTRNSDPKRPRRLVCFGSTVNKLVACFASSNERQKRQRYFKAILLHAWRSYIFRVFSRYICLLHTSINLTENVRIFTRMRKQWIPGALLRFFKRLGTRLCGSLCSRTKYTIQLPIAFTVCKNSWGRLYHMNHFIVYTGGVTEQS